jgi:hypothetical protein
LNFNSSAFSFNSVDEVKKVYSKIFQLMDELKEYSPEVCIKGGRFIIYLIGDDVSERELTIQKDLEKAYAKLYNKLKSFSQDYDYVNQVTFWRPFLSLSADLSGGDNRVFKTLSSLCPHMVNKEGYEWMKKYKKDENLEDISDSIHELGFLIEFVHDKKNTYRFKLIEW